ncbi:hypothetical protein H9P43_003230 [Blastocladiella emersonii ATCC 22665]|nr:hypothetical protein H9P43_003230 [Blastocladiella emersonii ATCC 22665]
MQVPSAHGDEEQGRFTPALWMQRRSKTLATLVAHQARVDWVADLGCNECALASVLVNSCVVSRVTCVDVDAEVLSRARHALAPTDRDAQALRERPLTVDLVAGSLAEYRPQLEGVRAIVLSEVIEHLDPPVLAQLPRALFEYYRPALVIVSTPNVEFNVHFDGWHPGVMRDPDHRFEWTRAEFAAWARAQANRYGYALTLDGVGYLPCCSSGEAHADLGPASQFATFVRIDPPPQEVAKWPVEGDKGDIEYPWYQGPDLTQLCNTGVEVEDVTPEEQARLDALVDLVYTQTVPWPPRKDTAHSPLAVSELWRTPAVRQTFRTVPLMLAFLASPAAERHGIVWAAPVDGVLDPVRVECEDASGGTVTLTEAALDAARQRAGTVEYASEDDAEYGYYDDEGEEGYGEYDDGDASGEPVATGGPGWASLGSYPARPASADSWAS